MKNGGRELRHRNFHLPATMGRFAFPECYPRLDHFGIRIIRLPEEEQSHLTQLNCLVFLAQTGLYRSIVPKQGTLPSHVANVRKDG